MPGRVDVVVNAKARGGRTGGSAELLCRHALQAGAIVHRTADLEELHETARAIASQGSGAVVLAGGDGSCMHGITALSRAFGNRPMPPVAFAAAGTVCTIARNVGAGRTAPPDRVISVVCNGGARRLRWPTLRVVDDAGRNQVGFIFGTGLVHRFFELYDASVRGPAAAAGLAARVLVGSFIGSSLARRVLDPMACTLAVEGKTHPSARWSLILASVVRDVGLHLRVPYRAGQEVNRFHLVASGQTARALAMQVPRALTGRPLGGAPLVDTLTPSLDVRFGSHEGGYVLDGERLEAGCVTVRAGPALDLLAV